MFASGQFSDFSYHINIKSCRVRWPFLAHFLSSCRDDICRIFLLWFVALDRWSFVSLPTWFYANFLHVSIFTCLWTNLYAFLISRTIYLISLRFRFVHSHCFRCFLLFVAASCMPLCLYFLLVSLQILPRYRSSRWTAGWLLSSNALIPDYICCMLVLLTGLLRWWWGVSSRYIFTLIKFRSILFVSFQLPWRASTNFCSCLWPLCGRHVRWHVHRPLG